MIKQFILKLLFWAVDYVYNYIDDDNDGQISMEELKKLLAKIQKLRKI